MKQHLPLIFLAAVVFACSPSRQEKTPDQGLSLTGTWKLISGTTIRGADTTSVDYTINQSFIKILNDSHFSFFRHDLNKGKDTTAVFSAGAGSYTLVGNTYTEQLDYFTLREWEGHQFEFTVRMIQDTLVQTGVEKIAELGVDQIIIEKYVRLK